MISPERATEVKKAWLLCSMTAADEPARWEDVSAVAGVTARGRRLHFETTVTALFWLMTASEEYDTATEMLPLADALYKELSVSPYLARCFKGAVSGNYYLHCSV